MTKRIPAATRLYYKSIGMRIVKSKPKKNRMPDMGNYKLLSRRALLKRFLENHNAAVEYNQMMLKAHDREWIAIKRAMKAEAEVKKLQKQIEEMKNAPELLFPR